MAIARRLNEPTSDNCTLADPLPDVSRLLQGGGSFGAPAASRTRSSNRFMVSTMDSQAEERARAIFLCEQMGLIPPHELPDFATELLVLGYDAPSLCELAGLPKGDRADAADMWNGVREELGIPAEDTEEAAPFLLGYRARETAQGRIDVVAGARLMCRVGWFPLGQPKELNELVYLLDVWDEMPHRREQTASEFLAFARNMVDSGS